MQQPHTNGIFEFDSGGPDAFGPYGRWTVTLDARGHLTLRHTASGRIREWGPVDLPAGESAALWPLVEAIDLAHLQSSTRMPVPDEGAYTFSLHGDRPPIGVQIWRHDALKNPQIAAFIAGLARVIHGVTGEQPVLH